MHRLRLASLFAIAVLFGTTAAQAQTSRGTVTGVVIDVSRASIPGAAVDITNKETNITRSTTTNEQGVYRFDAVDPGTYDVSVRAVGFRAYTSRAIPVSAAQTVAVDAQLEVGDASTTVEVTADAVALQTEAPVRGGSINVTQATHLPISSQNPVMLAITLPGVTEQRQGPGIGTFSVNGSRGRSNNFLLDGTENNDISVAGQAFQVKNPEAVQEVSVQTSNYDAEFGRAGGAVVNTITRSGTNELHGSLRWLSDFTNDDAITSTLSNDPKIKARGKLMPGYEQYYSGTIGGPIIRDKTFFFGSWQEQRLRASQSTTFTVPSALGRQQIRTAFPQGHKQADLYLGVTAGVEATGQFTNIDMGQGRGNAQFGTGVLTYPLAVNSRQSLNKIDHRFSDSDMMSVRYAYDSNKNPKYGVNFPGFFTSYATTIQNVVLTETHIFSPSLTNEIRLPFNRIAYDFALDPENPLGKTLPQYSMTGISAIGVSPSYPQGRIANNYQIQDTMSWVAGKHTVRIGLDLLQQRSRQFAPVYLRGTATYSQSSFGGTTYHALANFLDDYSGTGSVSRDFGEPAYYPELFRQAYFVQDRWQIRDNFTLSMGLRWEDFGTPANSLRTPAYAGIFNVQVNRANRTWTAPMTEPNRTDRDLNNFAPNIGLTYSPSFDSGVLGMLFGQRKTVLRSGYQIGYDSFFNNIASNAASSAPNMVTTTVVGQVTADTPRGIASFSSQIPTTPRAVLPIDGQNLVVKELKNPYTQRWSFGFQRELPWQTILETSYVGSSGTHLFINEDLNPQVVDPARRVLPSGFTSIADLQSALPAGYTLQPRLDPLQGGRTIRTNGGHSSYHALQFDFNKRFTRDLGFRASYTWSKMIDNASEIFTYNNTSSLAAVPSPFGGQPLERAVSLYDRTHAFTFSYTYELPFLRSQQGLVGRVLGGWQVAGIATLQTGVPYSVSNGQDADGLGGANDRPDVNPNGRAGVRARLDASSPTGYVNPDVLDASGRPVSINPAEARYIGVPAGSGRTGNAGRNTERIPGIRNWNTNLMKNIRVTERFNLQFRTEFFNVLNHPQYGYPSISPFTPGEGTIASNVFGSLAGRFMRPEFMDGGGRTVRYQLTLRF